MLTIAEAKLLKILTNVHTFIIAVLMFIAWLVWSYGGDNDRRS